MLVHDRTSSGLIVAREHTDARHVRDALKRLDPDLILAEPDAITPYWRVLKTLSRDQPAQVVCTWKDRDGTPLPLSSGLVEKVNSLRVDCPVEPDDAEAHNQKLLDAQRRDADEYLEWAADELVARLRDRKIHCLPRGAYRQNTMFKDGLR